MTTSTVRALSPSTVTAIQDAIVAARCLDDALLAFREGVHSALSAKRHRPVERSSDRTYRTDAFTIPDSQWRALAETLIGKLRTLRVSDRDVAAAVEWWFRFGPRVHDDIAA